MRTYTTPDIKIVNFTSENILTESSGWVDNGAGNTDNGGNIPGEIVGLDVPEIELAF